MNSIYSLLSMKPIILSPLFVLATDSIMPLIYDVGERDRKRPEGVGFDLRLRFLKNIDQVGMISRNRGFDGQIYHGQNISSTWVVGRNSIYYGQTIEHINLPLHASIIDGERPIHAIVFPRTSLHRAGIGLISDFWLVPPFDGPVEFVLKNLAGFDFEIESGTRVLNCVFVTFDEGHRVKHTEGIDRFYYSQPLTIGRILRLSDKRKRFLRKVDRDLGEVFEVAGTNTGRKTFNLDADDYVLVETREEVDLTNRGITNKLQGTPFSALAGVIIPNRIESGIHVIGTKVDPGYYGTITLGIYNGANRSISIHIGDNIASVYFLPVVGPVNPYQGQWRGGRVTTDGPEHQI